MQQFSAVVRMVRPTVVRVHTEDARARSKLQKRAVSTALLPTPQMSPIRLFLLFLHLRLLFRIKDPLVFVIVMAERFVVYQT